MRIVIAGGSGFLGQALTQALARQGHELVILTRRLNTSPAATLATWATWTPDGEVGPWAQALEGADVVINLAGDSIAEGRWTPAKKTRVLESRVRATKSLVRAAARASAPPRVFVSGSAVGYYGPLGDEVVTEANRAGSDFLAQVCTAWEQEAAAAERASTRVVILRTGLVLDTHGGALPRMLLPFRLGVGGRLGAGRQYWPWIHVHDWVALVAFVLTTASATGPFNLTAPTPVTNAEFTAALGRALKRPAVMPAPAFALRLALGEMADALLLSGQRAVPAKAERLGFSFRYPTLDTALASLLGR